MGLSYGEVVPRYETPVIAQQGQASPSPIWVLPDTAGAVRPNPTPTHLKGIEPPLVVELDLLDDETLVGIEPTEMFYIAPKAGAVTLEFEFPASARVSAIRKSDGSTRWSHEITEAGMYDIVLRHPVLLVSVRHFDSGTWRPSGESLIALDPASGRRLWSARDSAAYVFVGFSGDQDRVLLVTSRPPVGQGASASATFRLVELRSGTRIAEWTSPEGMASMPVLAGVGVLAFEPGLSFRRLADGSPVWQRQDLRSTSSSAPVVGAGVAYIGTGPGVVAIDLASGRELWSAAHPEGVISGLTVSGALLIVRSQGVDERRPTHTVRTLDRVTGQERWTHTGAGFGAGGLGTDSSTVFYSTWEQVVALDRATGRERFRQTLPWQERASAHEIRVRSDRVIVGNEWHAAAWATTTGAPLFHHAFEPLWPAVTTEARRLDEVRIATSDNPNAALAAAASGAWSLQYHDFAMRNIQSSITAADRRWREHGDLMALQTKRNLLGIQGAALETQAAMERAQAATAFLHAFASGMEGLAWAFLAEIHVRAYLPIDRELAQLRRNDTEDRIVRLTGVQRGNQRFAAIEVLDLHTGRTTQLLLSPFQSPGMSTAGTKWVAARTGYLRVASLLHQNFRVAVDLRSGMVFHYGPGLRPADYTHNKDGYAQGRLMALRLPPQ